MKVNIHTLNKAFENRVRLGIMSALIAGEEMDFNRLKEILEVTDGNLASHLKALEKEEYIEVQKSFVGRKPNTKYVATKAGKVAFMAHIDALEALIKEQTGRG
ncbi:transcriptional regulator [Roseivirga ehrenbergii]|uniref:Transcriptional regulator n=1 Tax=Roseivirga ehrenbergii (strain DSM 102268 / JCM 13514 / KCTC 12282 / NCIMB 14502 / KMM 6017) TaxID=279360 RepID=A0A150XS78_ROSEK|nr:transcriptional regulator [Roseivirga ehrenbergii]KYG81536.1 transcriptional regulator [Roseivirga ehrenbergii]TCL10698.1 transcriptional regulator [Roseivirga ehrenbergii]